MHYRILFIGTKKSLKSVMSKFCDDNGRRSIKNAKCDYYGIEGETTKKSIDQIGGVYYGIIKDGRWYQRKSVPTDFWKRMDEGNPHTSDELTAFTETEKEKWDTRGKSLLKNISNNQKILVLDVHN